MTILGMTILGMTILGVVILRYALRLLRCSVELTQVGKLLGYLALQSARRRPVPIHFRHAFRKIMLVRGVGVRLVVGVAVLDRKSTRLNSSHANISYAVFCL